MLDLEKRGRDIRRFVHALEQWIADALASFGINAYAVEGRVGLRSEEHTSELQSLMRISYAVFCLKKKNKTKKIKTNTQQGIQKKKYTDIEKRQRTMKKTPKL